MLLTQRHRQLLQQEQLLIEKRIESFQKTQAALEDEQQHKLAQRAALSLISAIKEEEEAAAARNAERKQLIQTLRHEALQAQQAPLTAAEQQLLQQLPQQLQQQQQLLQQLLLRVEEAAAALSEAEETIEVTLRRGVDRLEREAREEEGEDLGFRVYERVDAEAAALLKTRQQQEDAAAEIDTAIRALESQLSAAREHQTAAERKYQTAAANILQINLLLQQKQTEAEAAM
ncbi:hypothetical protein EPH_0042080 [Eimeria praecox]|uniref:Uncharacterized protein n=1 Tax=Eimeria praecox TaxID=51316 RepID=U6G7Y1_9EIME|nr:hypothetical protein EPH_0042080 [Eimeria praecox]